MDYKVGDRVVITKPFDLYSKVGQEWTLCKYDRDDDTWKAYGTDPENEIWIGTGVFNFTHATTKPMPNEDSPTYTELAARVGTLEVSVRRAEEKLSSLLNSDLPTSTTGVPALPPIEEGQVWRTASDELVITVKLATTKETFKWACPGNNIYTDSATNHQGDEGPEYALVELLCPSLEEAVAAYRQEW